MQIRYFIFSVIFIQLLSLHLWSDSDLKTVRNQYVEYDNTAQNFKKNNNALIGLKIDHSIANKNFVLAKQLLGPIPPALKGVTNLKYAHIACAEERCVNVRKYLKNTHSLLLNNINIIEPIYHLLPTNDKNWLVKELLKGSLFEAPVESSCPYFELAQRKNRADFLYKIIASHKLTRAQKNKIFYELFVFLPETFSYGELLKLNGFQPFSQKASVKDLVKRMELLLTFGRNDEARKTFELATAVKRSKEDLCELNYVDAKVDRKLKKYKLARERLSKLQLLCQPSVQIKARYMDLMLASMTGDEASLPLFTAFAKDYPGHALSDDALLFQASLLFEKRRDEEALVVLDKIISEYPTGDMVYRAQFLKAFHYAKNKNTILAIKEFNSLEKRAPKNSLDQASAIYWASRLAIFPDPNSFQIADRKEIAKQKPRLLELIFSPASTVYSWLSVLVLEACGEKIDAKPPVVKASNSHPVTEPELSFVKDLVSQGFRTEALAVLDGLSTNEKSVGYLTTVAQFYDMLNRPEQGHQKLIRCQSEKASMLRTSSPQLYQALAYPRGFKKEVDQALLHITLPEALVFAVIREESGFFEKTRSWANALGPMQVVFTSAKSQAKLYQLTNLVEDDLYDPRINILLGSSLLYNYWQRFSNVVLGLAAYNAGPSAARVWQTKHSAVPTDTLLENISFKETRTYVKHVLGSAFNYAQNTNGLPKLNEGPPLQKTVIGEKTP